MPPVQTEYMKRQMYTVKQKTNIFRIASQMGLVAQTVKNLPAMQETQV